nr:uncharacterized protein K02A2.6-like [Coffea arabica]
MRKSFWHWLLQLPSGNITWKDVTSPSGQITRASNICLIKGSLLHSNRSGLLSYWDYTMTFNTKRAGRMLLQMHYPEEAARRKGDCRNDMCVIPEWVKEVEESYQGDAEVQEMIRSLILTPGSLQDYSCQNGILKYKGRVVVGNGGQIRRKIITALHDSQLGGHSGVQASYLRAKQFFHWPGMYKEVKDTMLQCNTCRRCKDEHVAYPDLLQPLPIPQYSWSHVTMDFIEGLPTSERKDTILVTVDRFTKYAHFTNLTYPFDAPTVARVFLDQVCRLHGMPLSMLSDRDKIFTSQFWTELFSLMGTELCLSTVYHPQTDGQSERVNQVATLQAKFCGDEKQHQTISKVLLALSSNPKDRKGSLQTSAPSFITNTPSFHVSLLKRKIGQKVVPVLQLPDTNEKGHFRIEPIAVLDRRIVKKKNAAAVQWLIQW